MFSAARFASLLAALPLGAGTAAAEPECVVLLHGILASDLFMQPLERALCGAGYRTINVSYPSREQAIEEVATKFLPAELTRHDAARAPRLHFVAHSMGGLIVRAFLEKTRPANLGRVVMLGTPNRGSEVADHLAELEIFRTLIGVNLVALRTNAESAVKTQDPVNYDVGIIAGDASINPLFERWVGGESDGPVAVESTKLAGMRDFIVVPYSHTAMLWRQETARQVLAFLRDGRFARTAAPP